MESALPDLPLSRYQLGRLHAFHAEALSLNARLNLYSADSAADFWRRHILHSLSIGALHPFLEGATIVDWGTGGGLPGIPLAIAFPRMRFTLVDSVGKKVRAVRLMARRLGLANVTAWHGRAETWPGRAHYAVSRATAPLADLWSWTARVLEPVDHGPNDWHQGLLALKGGELEDEVAELQRRDPRVRVSALPLQSVLKDPFFDGKTLLHARPS